MKPSNPVYAPSKPRCFEKAGFSLIVTVTLLILLSMLSVGLLGLSSNQLRSTRSQQMEFEARANARLALQVAIGQLQKYAGPDTRVTAKAELLNAGGATQMNANALRWTGVWSSNDDHLAGAPELGNGQPVWLVSGRTAGRAGPTPDQAPASFSTVGSGDGPREVALFSPARPGSTAQSVANGSGAGGVSEHQALTVALERIQSAENEITGAFGYAVSDENLKAAINLPSEAEEQVRALYASAVNPQLSALEGGQPLRDLSWFDDDKAKAYASLATLGANSTTARRPEVHLENDLTAFSRSLLVDVAEGGLKTDLTLGLESSETNFGKFLAAAPHNELIFPSSEQSGDPGGPRWEQLRNFLNQRVASRNAVVNAQPPSNDDAGVAPVIALMQWTFKVFAVPHANGTPVETISIDDARSYNGGATFYAYFCPSLVLWNPYDVDMAIGEIFYQHTFRGIRAYLSNGSKSIEIFPNAGRQPSQNEGAPVVKYSLNPGIIPAGSTKRFGAEGYRRYSDDPQNNRLTEVSDLLTVGGFYYEKPDASWDIRSLSTALVGFTDNFWNAHSSLNESPDFDVETKLVSVNHGGSWANLINENFKIDLFLMGRSDLPGLGNPNARLSYGEINPPVNDLTNPDYHQSKHELLLGFQYFIPFPQSEQVANPQSFVNWRNEGGKSFQMDILSAGNVRSPFFNRMAVNGDNGQNVARPFSSSPIYIAGAVNNGLGFPLQSWIPSGSTGVNLGNTIDFGLGVSKYSLFEYPKEEKVFRSIGELAQANLFHITNTLNEWGQNITPNAFYPTFPIGNSYSPTIVPLDREAYDHGPNHAAGPQDTGYTYDYSYVLNKHLWDRYFFSTYDKGPQREEPENHRLHFENNGRDPIEPQTIAAHMAIEGGFNVNSASPNAWKAILAAFRDQEVAGQKNSGTDPMIRFDDPLGPPMAESPTTDDPAAYEGYRALTDEQIETLANQIVRFSAERSSSRGRPALSLAEFINRSLEGEGQGNHEFGSYGVIQQALDHDDNSGFPINDAFDDTNAGFILNNHTLVSEGAMEAIANRKLSTGIPGYLMQSDILARIGSVLTARGDTFKIRAYGDSRAADGTVRAKAYCEAVVQREIEYVDESNLPSHDDPDTLSVTNRKFGRRFALVSFRWLNENEI
ncbi:type IV pilus modification PilV family protein [Roseibacillus ishigakijimensis]|uniref:Uncharacterized protein n=1 Tax=Roseibacillus ishigakijimensis TaxID=454146 RepID=A0A934VL88_9BACT|nr:hypothetical protein [Roseibacillus ishigakijimensis]MBK1832625.1 hypothetical protein [Roseibacillus ishigakijimensis]